jgi:hypothetical protein
MQREVLGALLLCATAALANDKPAAVQVCLTLPSELPLFATQAGPAYRLLGEGVFVLDLDVALNGHVVTKLTRSSADCFRAMVPATAPVRRVAVSFERTALNLTDVQRQVDLKVKPDLWYDAGRFVVTQAPWSSIGLGLPGQLTLERKVGEATFTPWADPAQVPAGQYKVAFELPAAMRACAVTLRTVALGSIREDNKKELFDELVAAYRTDFVPEVMRDQKLLCDPDEALQIELRLVDGVYIKPREPKVTKVKLPNQAPRYALNVDGVRSAFENGQVITVHTGEHLTIEGAAPLSANR